MIDEPKTLAEAQITRYGYWAGNPKGVPYCPNQCAYRVFPANGRWHQCSRRKGHGPDGLYCQQHAAKLKT